MKLIDLEKQLAFCRANGATDDSVVLGFVSQERLTPFSGATIEEINKQKKYYFTVKEVSLGERLQEYGGGKVIRIYHYAT